MTRNLAVDMRKIAAKHAVEPILDINVYWHTAIGLVDTWSKYSTLKRQFENAHKIWSVIEDEYGGDLCKLELKRDEFDELVNLTLAIFELVCVNFNVEPITRKWLEEKLGDSKSRKRAGVTCKKMLYSRTNPMPLRGII